MALIPQSERASFVKMQRAQKRTLQLNRLLMSLSTALWIAMSAGAQAQPCEHEFYRPSYKTRGSYCTVGQYVGDQYAAGRKVKCEDVEVDHLISLFYAYSQGICGDTLKRLANDPRNLRFTHRQTNRAKGSKSPEEFALSLTAPMSEQVKYDADALRAEYGLKPIANLSGSQRANLLVEELEANKRQIGELTVVSPDVRARVVHYKDKQLPLSAAVAEHTTTTRRRLVGSARRNFAAMPAEALPWFGVSVILAATAWEVYDLCEALKDNHELAVAFNPDLKMTEDIAQVCATKVPTREELVDQMASAPSGIWERAKETYSNIEVSAPSMADLGAYIVAAKTTAHKLNEQAQSKSQSLWQRANEKFQGDSGEEK
ncbi:hypothetical protein HKX17_17670 [Sulfitobacter sp. KE34]|uniref:hypothetical protein n=1 Tax=unclassified Sulfitobacter TaxID=196795 RepID=UPI0023E2171E|nr:MULTISPECIES: hypothetical protein [unclassified Sulfitobacter]MDF3351930.1 hypothetical protein [Sulfitobacter sp. KE12]MDF3355601.1 hypothetical protein [Sulfitobacter sp. KE27]MDF3359292.1 hypothetical protein [Sulfitobacter sp. KE33]MDF3366716.1 hypothetical protein [Sulfitobacter sp. Ks34]MDF3370282.1 hypothetical protein [Sulfitobacter sp. Ks43]